MLCVTATQNVSIQNTRLGSGHSCNQFDQAWHLSTLAAVQMVAGLPTLTRLTLTSTTTYRSRMPRCEELASLRSTSLQDLHVKLYQVLRQVAHCAGT